MPTELSFFQPEDELHFDEKYYDEVLEPLIIKFIESHGMKCDKDSEYFEEEDIEYDDALVNHEKIAFILPPERSKELCLNVSANIKQEFEEASHSDSLERTVEINVNKAEVNVKCADTIETHIEVTPVGPTSSCDKCDYKAKQISNLKVHIETHNEVDPVAPTSSCDKCDYKAKQISNLKVHIETAYRNVTFSCDQCDYKAKSKTGWKQHIEVTHRNTNIPLKGGKIRNVDPVVKNENPLFQVF